MVAVDHLTILDRHRQQESLTAQIVFDAVCLRLASAIEAADRIDQSLLKQEFGDEWRDIRGMRNAIAHNYVFVDPLAVAATLEPDIERFAEGLQNIRRDLETLGA